MGEAVKNPHIFVYFASNTCHCSRNDLDMSEREEEHTSQRLEDEHAPASDPSFEDEQDADAAEILKDLGKAEIGAGSSKSAAQVSNWR